MPDDVVHLGRYFKARGSAIAVIAVGLVVASLISFSAYRWGYRWAEAELGSQARLMFWSILGGVLLLIGLLTAYVELLTAGDRRFRALFDSVTEAIATFDPMTRALIDVNKSGYEMFGYAAKSEVLGLTIDDISAGTPPYTGREAAEWIKTVFIEGPRTLTWHAKKKDGSLFWVEVNARVVIFAALPVILLSARDISDRVKTDSALRESEERFRAIFTSVSDALMVVDLRGGELLDFNPQAANLFGYSQREFQKRGVAGLLASGPPGFQLEQARTHLRSKAKDAPGVEWQCRAKDGHLFWVDASLRIADFGATRVLLLAIRDITERKNSAEILAYRDRILNAVTMGTAALAASETLELGMSTALSIVGQTVDVDRVLVLQMEGDPSRAPKLRFGWQSTTVLVHLDQALLDATGEGETSAAQGEWIDSLRRRKPVIVHRSKSAGALRALLERTQNLSMLLVPIFVGAELWGTIGLDECDAERVWSEAEIEVLQTFADVIGILILRNTAQVSLKSSEERFRAVTETAQDAIVVLDSLGAIQYWNNAASAMLGYSSPEAQRKVLRDWLVPEALKTTAAARALTPRSGETLGKPSELTVLCKDGSAIPIEISVSNFSLATERYAVAIMRDISERKKTEEQISQLVRYDLLTGLPNRRAFVEALEQAIARARRDGNKFAVLYLDLDHFKDINDTLSHPVGDLLLQKLAARYHQHLRETDTIARFGGDEFAVIQADIRDPADAAVLAEKLLKSASEPISIQGSEIRTSTSIGIAVYGLESPDAETILSQADVALYRTKSEGRGTYRFFTDAMDKEVRNRVSLASDLRAALSSNQLLVLYQPQVDAVTRDLVGMEALVRWDHPTRGLLMADDFVPVAENSGLIVALGHWVLREVCRQIKTWLDMGLTPPVVAVNVSALQFRHPRELEADLVATFAETELKPEMLELELTESTLMQVSREHNEALAGLKKLGVRIAIDDFGTGYSSLDYLRRFPVDRIKIAQAFVRDLPKEGSNGAIIRAAIGLAHELGLQVVTEGVETEEQARLIAAWGARQVQGFYFSQPLLAKDMLPILRAGKLRLASLKPVA